jgi:hypothetical protein
MTAEEKAKELFDKMLNGFQYSIDEYTAKQCALTSVDQIIDVLSSTLSYGMQYLINLDYWIEVKQEILKL